VSHPQTGQEPGLLARQVDVLELIARDLTLDTVLEKICRMAEALVPGSLAGVTILDRAGVAFEGCVMPSAPTFAAAIAGIEVGPPHAGTCAAAVYSGMPVSSADAATDERFDPLWRRLNAEHGVRCIKSRPVTSADGRALGSFLIAFAAETPSWPEEIEATCARLAGFALERHRAVERNRLIVSEMQHRLKNLFASVLSIAAQTSQSRQTSAEFVKAFEGRVLALAAAHDLLSQDESADLAELARRIVGPFTAAVGAIEIAGKPFKVAPSSVVPFSLVLHELATNAAKYGALSNAKGKARISWKYYRTESGERRFKFKWEESGGPSVVPPRRSGFGTILMKRAFADVEGQSRLTHAPEGLRYRVDAPVSGRLGRLQEGAAPGADGAAD